MIVAHALTEPTVDAATIGIDLIETVDDEIARVTADAAYETVAFYEAAGMRDATVVVLPSKTARVSRRRPRSRARDRTITDVRTLGRRRWKQEAGYPLQARVENAFFRYKSILGDRLRARSRGGRVAESVVACNVLNQMTELGRPESYSIGRCLASGLGSLTVSFESCTSAYDRRRVSVAGRPVTLTSTEYELLRVLAQGAGRVLTHEDLLRQVWAGRGHGKANPKIVRAYVKRLRHQLGDDAARPAWIVNERGVGYRMARPGEAGEP